MTDNPHNRLSFIFACAMITLMGVIAAQNVPVFKPYYQAILNYVSGNITNISTITNISADTDSKNYQNKAPKTSVTYDDAQAQLRQQRVQLASAYNVANSAIEKHAIIEQARASFITSITTLLPYWYGTPWNFNGASKTPQQGHIACGYYVSTVLRDAGLDIERNKLAQQASENIIKSLTDDAHIKRFSDQSIDDFLAVVDEWGAGLYVVGLDFHVGYLWHDGNQMHFIHATGLPPKSALSEPAETSPALTHSRYRVIGKISDDDMLIEKWLLKTAITTKT